MYQISPHGIVTAGALCFSLEFSLWLCFCNWEKCYVYCAWKDYHSALHSTKTLKIICSSVIFVSFFSHELPHKSLPQLSWWIVIAGCLSSMTPLDAGIRPQPLLHSVISQFSVDFLKYKVYRSCSHLNLAWSCAFKCSPLTCQPWICQIFIL